MKNIIVGAIALFSAIFAQAELGERQHHQFRMEFDQNGHTVTPFRFEPAHRGPITIKGPDAITLDRQGPTEPPGGGGNGGGWPPPTPPDYSEPAPGQCKYGYTTGPLTTNGPFMYHSCGQCSYEQGGASNCKEVCNQGYWSWGGQCSYYVQSVTFGTSQGRTIQGRGMPEWNCQQNFENQWCTNREYCGWINGNYTCSPNRCRYNEGSYRETNEWHDNLTVRRCSGW